MSLRDTACYTLTINATPDPNMVELVELSTMPTPTPTRDTRYVRLKENREEEAYSGVIYDALSGAKLASMGYGSFKDKRRRLELHNPDEIVPFDYTGKINFEWSFVFEQNTYRWTREVYGKDYICSLDRKPDPRVEVCLAREADKNNPGRLQILHYNLDRFTDDIKDLRGLETLLTASMLLFIDSAEERSCKPIPSRPTMSASSSATSQGASSAPVLPDKPVKVISEEDFEPENPNEIIVGLNTNIDEHVARAIGLLEDQQTLFVVVRTRNASATQRALEVSLGVTRFRHRENLAELHQYVIEEEPPKQILPPSSPPARPSVINLDDPVALPTPKSPTPATKQWAAPNIAIYLSKIEIPDLHPGRRETLKAKQSRERVPSASSSASPGPATSLARPVSHLPSQPPPQSARPPSSTPRPSGSMVTAHSSSNAAPAVPPRPSPPAAASGSSSAGANGPKPGGGVSLTRLFKAAASKI